VKELILITITGMHGPGIAGLGIAFHAKPIVKESAEQSLNAPGLDGILYLMGFSERETKTS
jgi:phosphoserine phosphatase